MSKSVAFIAPVLAIVTMLTITMFANVGVPAAWADDVNENEAHQALERGDIRPLDQVLDVARKRVPGDVVKVELEHDDGRWTYEIKILTDEGERRKVEVDANTLRVLKVD